MARMRFDEVSNTQEEFPPRSTETGRLIRSPNDPEFVVRTPWKLDGMSYDALGDPIEDA
jgi:hypothetical protein